MTFVVDASVVLAALIDRAPEGVWAEDLLRSDRLAAPHLLLVEVANILRREALRGVITQDGAALAHANLLALDIELYPYAPLAARVWDLRGNLTAYDAWYVALAEAFDAPLATLDGRLARASGTHCRFVLP